MHTTYRVPQWVATTNQDGTDTSYRTLRHKYYLFIIFLNSEMAQHVPIKEQQKNLAKNYTFSHVWPGSTLGSTS